MSAAADPVLDLIEAEARAYAVHDAACRLTDAVVLGREPNEDEQTTYDRASEAQWGILRLVMTAPTTPMGAVEAISLFEEREMQNVGAPVDDLLRDLFATIRRQLGVEEIFTAQPGETS